MVLQTCVDSALQHLDYLENEPNFPSEEKSHLQNLRIELRFLRTILTCWANFCFGYEDASLGSLMEDLQHRAYEAVLDLQSVQGMIPDFNSMIDPIKIWVEIFRPQEKEDYSNSLGYSKKSDNPMSAELLVELIDSVLENLNDLLNFKKGLLDSLRKQIKPFEGKLRFLRNFILFTEKKCTEPRKLEELWARSRDGVKEAARIVTSCWISNLDGDKNFRLVIVYSQLLSKIKPTKVGIREIYCGALKASKSSVAPVMDDTLVREFIEFLLENLVELLYGEGWAFTPVEDQVCFINPIRDQMRNLHKGLNFLRNLFVDQLKSSEQHEDSNDLLAQIIGMAIDAGIIIYSSYTNGITEGEAREANLGISDFLERIEMIKNDAEPLFLSKFPKTDELGFIDILIDNLKQLLSHTLADSVASEKHQIRTVIDGLVYLRRFLGDISEHHNEHEELRALWNRIVNVAYDAEYAIDSLVVGDCPGWYKMLCNTVAEEIKLITIEVEENYNNKRDEIGPHEVPKHSSPTPVQTGASSPAIHEVVVGFKDEAETIINRLTRGSMQRDVIPIIGMPGLGKTTLAKKVYNDLSVRFHFYIRAWCIMSHEYRKRELLLDILNDVVEVTHAFAAMTEEDLSEMLSKQLKGRRYLIVLDDIRDIGAWDNLTESLPDENNGSRILFTSRLQDVPKFGSSPFFLHPLSEYESWELLQAKLFHGECCPSALWGVGKLIAKNCKGLPLAIVIIGGFLARMEKNPVSWNQVAESLTPDVVSESDWCKGILGLSYKHLPIHLKPCFLYFGAFQENEEILVHKLMWLWIAEGFIQKVEVKSLEDVAEDYLSDLISRSLVTVTKRRSTGSVKACHIHDLLRDLCLAKAKEENFLQLINSSDMSYFHVGTDLFTNPIPYEQRRLCINFDKMHFIASRPSGPRVRSLLIADTKVMSKGYWFGYAIFFHVFKLLRVLNLWSINLDGFAHGITLMVHLRYLAVCVRTKNIPSSISNLWRLETFLVKGSRGAITLPNSIWNMSSLRHLHVNDHAFELQSQVQDEATPGNSSELPNLETISTPCLSYGENVDKMVRRFPNIRKLRCTFTDSWNQLEECNLFPRLGFLSQLESLKVFYQGKVFQPCVFNLPSNLKKLSLSKFKLPWSNISMIRKLPNLEVLKLLEESFEGNQWEAVEEEFPKLKYLKLDNLHLVEWNTSKDHFPCLQQLVLRKCKKLKEIPLCIGEIDTLQKIEVQWCSNYVSSSAKQIQEDQIEVGNERLKVFICPSD